LDELRAGSKTLVRSPEREEYWTKRKAALLSVGSRGREKAKWSAPCRTEDLARRGMGGGKWKRGPRYRLKQKQRKGSSKIYIFLRGRGTTNRSAKGDSFVDRGFSERVVLALQGERENVSLLNLWGISRSMT